MGVISNILKTILTKIVTFDFAEILHGGPQNYSPGVLFLLKEIVGAILDLIGVLWKTLDLNSAAILIRIFSKFGVVVEGAKFSGSF